MCILILKNKMHRSLVSNFDLPSTDNNKIKLIYNRTRQSSLSAESTLPRRSFRKLDHMYDLDISSEPALPFKKTRDGFKIKKTSAKIKATKKVGKSSNNELNKKITKKVSSKSTDIVKQAVGNVLKNSVNIRLEVRSTRMREHNVRSKAKYKILKKVTNVTDSKSENIECNDFLEKSGDAHGNSKPDISIPLISKDTQVPMKTGDMRNNYEQKRLEVRLIRMKESDILAYTHPVLNDIMDSGDENIQGDDFVESYTDIHNSYDIINKTSLPMNSTPVNVRPKNKPDLRKSIYKDFGSPIKFSPLKDHSPWRMNVLESNRLPANFSMKNLLIPSYDRDISLSFPSLGTSPIKPAQKTTSTNRVRLFEDDIVQNTIVNISESPMKSEPKAVNSTRTRSEHYVENNVTNTRSPLKQLQISNKINKSSSVTTVLNEPDHINNLYGFDTTDNENFNMQKVHNKNVPKATRVSLSEIKNVFYNNRKQDKCKDKENRIIENVKSVIEIERVDINTELNIENNAGESKIQVEFTSKENCPQSTSNQIVLFDDPEVFKHNESYRSYYPKKKKKRQDQALIMRKDGGEVASPKKKKVKNLLTTEEWVEAKTWERNFNAMVKEVESFEMVIE